jgi:hypothetical protein
MRHARLVALSALFLAATAALGQAEPLSNEDLLALRSAERIAELGTEISPNNARRQARFMEAWDLMAPILERPLPADRRVWVSLGRWAAAADNPAAGAVVLAGLRQDVPDFMDDAVLATIAADLNADTATRELAARAAERFEAGDTPAEAIHHLGTALHWEGMLEQAVSIEDPSTAAATLAALGSALDKAELSQSAEAARDAAGKRLAEIQGPADLARTLVATAEGQLYFDGVEEAVANLSAAAELTASLQDDAARSRLETDIARLRARAGRFDEAAQAAMNLEPPLASEVYYEIVRARVARQQLDEAELAISLIAHDDLRNLAKTQLVKGLAKQDRVGEAEDLIATIRERTAQTEASAVLAFHTPAKAFERQLRLWTIFDDAPENRAAALIRVISLQPNDAPQLRALLINDLGELRDMEDRRRILLAGARYAAEHAAGEFASYLASRDFMRDRYPEMSRYRILAQAAEQLDTGEAAGE